MQAAGYFRFGLRVPQAIGSSSRSISVYHRSRVVVASTRPHQERIHETGTEVSISHLPGDRHGLDGPASYIFENRMDIFF